MAYESVMPNYEIHKVNIRMASSGGVHYQNNGFKVNAMIRDDHLLDPILEDATE